MYDTSKFVQSKSTLHEIIQNDNIAISGYTKHSSLPSKWTESLLAYVTLLADTIIGFVIIIIVAFLLFTSCAGRNLSPIYTIKVIAQHLLMH